MSEERKQLILNAINIELARQGGEIDPMVLATAVDAALGADTLEAGSRPANTTGAPGAGSSPKNAYANADEGKTPDELNAANDE
ncbi:MAG: hypothetical protein ABI377_05220 [Devosia sp.]